MTEIEKLEDELTDQGVIVDDRLLGDGDPAGLCMTARGQRPVILVNRELSGRRKLCILAEEAGHLHRTNGPAFDPRDATQRKNELSGRRWAYQRLVPLDRLICAWYAGCRAPWSMARYFGVTEIFFQAALEYYHSKYGVQKTYPGYVIQFDPYFRVYSVRIPG